MITTHYILTCSLHSYTQRGVSGYVSRVVLEDAEIVKRIISVLELRKIGGKVRI